MVFHIKNTQKKHTRHILKNVLYVFCMFFVCVFVCVFLCPQNIRNMYIFAFVLEISTYFVEYLTDSSYFLNLIIRVNNITILLCNTTVLYVFLLLLLMRRVPVMVVIWRVVDGIIV